ncbi:ROK family protein [Salinimicrobium sp. GXAS 041]|uniref:ROK family protein n=1 Tax=Salinimicrobium sp. GXAS 041 TaxID=3400806 RepID=UPI003C7911B4
MMYSVGVDIGGSHVASCMFEHRNKILQRNTWVYRPVDTMASKNVIIRQWVETIKKSIELSGQEIVGVGIAIPGPFKYFEGISMISGVEKLEALYEVNVREELAEKLNIPASKIRFINDAAAFSIAETAMGPASEVKKVVAITLGTGLGSCFLHKGLPLLDHAKVPKGGFLYNQVYHGKNADDVFSTRGIQKHYYELAGKTVNSVKELADTAAYDTKAAETFQWFGVELGKFLAPYLQEFEAEMLVIGGNISKAKKYFMPGLMAQVKHTRIYISNFGEEAAVIGSSLLLEDDFYTSLIPTLKSM